MTVFKSITVFFLVAILFFIFVSCSGSSKDRKSPIEPDLQISESPALSEYDDAYGRAPIESALLYDPLMADYIPHSVGANILGAFELTIDIDSMSADLIPKRQSAIGESWIVSGKSFFDMSPCTDCFKINGLGYDDGRIVVQFGVRHPFEKGDRESAPSAKNRLDLDIFDLAMVVVPIPFETIDYPTMGIEIPSYSIHNPDGYTNEFSGVYGSPIALPYVLVIDDSRDDPPSNTFNRFEMGASTEFQAEFPVTPGQTLSFDLYLTFGYGFSAELEDRLEPKYFNPEFNRKAAWKVEVILPNGDEEPEWLNTWDDTDNSTEYDATVKVYDWQIGANVNPDLEEPTDIYAASGVDKVSLKIPGMFYGNKDGTELSGTGMPSDPLIYTISVANENLLPVGEYLALVAVYDERPPLPISESRDYLIHTPDGGETLREFEIPAYVTYQTFTATVVDGSCGPVSGNIISPSCPVTGLYNGLSTIDFVVEASSQGGGNPIVLYEIDYNYDGVTFNAHDSNTTGIFSGAGPWFAPDPCDDNVPYSFIVAFRATDSCDPPNVTVFATCEVVVENYNTHGNLIWAKNPKADRPTYYYYSGGFFSITSLNDNSIVMAGQFDGNITFSEGEPNETTLISEGRDILIARYNPDGTFQWAKNIGTTTYGGLPGTNAGIGITSLPDDSVVVTGFFQGTAIFGEGEPNETTLISPSPGGGLNIFIARYNSDGTLQWVKQSGGEGGSIAGAITSLSDNSIVIMGELFGVTIFGEGEPNQTTLVPEGGFDRNIFIARYNPDGTLHWAKKIVGAISHSYYYGHPAITSLSDDSTVMTGYFRTSAIFGLDEPNETTLISSGREDIFIARHNPDGTLAWAKRAGGEDTAEARAITALSDDSTIVTGFFRDQATFGEGEPNETTLTIRGHFIAKYNSDGMLEWAIGKCEDTGGTSGYGVTTLSDDSFVVTGVFGGEEPNLLIHSKTKEVQRCTKNRFTQV